MIVLKYLLVALEALCSLLLIGIILIQRSKGEGLGMAFGGGAGEALFGSRAGNVLTKGTVILAVVFVLNTLLLGVVFSRSGTRSVMAAEMQAPPVQQAQPAPAAAPPFGGVPGQQAQPVAPVAAPVGQPAAQPVAADTVMQPMAMPMEAPELPQQSAPAAE